MVSPPHATSYVNHFTTRFVESRMVGFPEYRIPGISNSRNFGFSESRILGTSCSRNLGFSESRILVWKNISEISESREIEFGCSFGEYLGVSEFRNPGSHGGKNKDRIVFLMHANGTIQTVLHSCNATAPTQSAISQPVVFSVDLDELCLSFWA